MRPSISFDDITLRLITKSTRKYDTKKDKYVERKNPIITKGKTLQVGDCWDLFDFVRKLDHHTDMIDSSDDYIEVKFKFKTMY